MHHPYAPFIHLVQKPARYLGGEYGEIRKPWDKALYRICLAFPDLYELGMSHLGFKILYSAINRHPDLLAERAFAPWFDMEAELRARAEPLRSLESARPLRDFDVVGFSLQFELAYTNLLQMLELGGIALRAADRGDRDPLILAGGPGAVHPEPVAPFIDAFLVGDGEEAAIEILLRYGRLCRSGLSRTERLRSLAELSGVYVPALYRVKTDGRTGLQYIEAPTAPAAFPIRRRFVADLDQYPFPTDGPVPDTEIAFDRASVEIARGCTEGCRFCQAGSIYRPVREHHPRQVIEVAEKLARTSGYEAASLTSLSTADYSAIGPLIHALAGRFVAERVSLVVSSLRAYGLEPAVLGELRRGRSTGLTFALEAASQRLRDVINKNVTEAQLLETARHVFSYGWDKIKLYFMIGLPTEEEGDIRAIIATAARVRGIGREICGRRAGVVVNVSTHVPKPHTPFQWCAMDSIARIEHKQALLKDEARRAGLTLRLHSAPASWLEAVLARGDRSVANAIEAAFRGGARFDSWSEQLKLEIWKRALAETGITPDRYLAALTLDARLPWDHIDVGVDREFFLDQYRKALAGRPSPPCGKEAPRTGDRAGDEQVKAEASPLICYQCGIGCDLQAIQTARQTRLAELQTQVSGEPSAEQERVEVASTDTDIHANRGRQLPGIRHNEMIRIRLGFSKLGRAIYASHLDLIRALTRLCRRAGLPLHYTQGFHPKALMSFSPALSVGIASLCEYVDIALREKPPVDCDHLPDLLSQVAPDGLRFFAARTLGSGDAKLGAVIDQAEYVAAISQPFLEQIGIGDFDTLKERIDSRKSADLEITRVIEGVSKRVNVSHYLAGVAPGHGAEVLRQAGLPGDLVPVTLNLLITGGGSAKVSEALAVLLGVKQTPARFVRSALLCTRGSVHASPIDLEALRSLR